MGKTVKNMMTIKEQRKACISLASMLENVTDDIYIDVTNVYAEVTIHCNNLIEMAEVNRFLTKFQPYELKKRFHWNFTSKGDKFYACNLKVVGYKK